MKAIQDRTFIDSNFTLRDSAKSLQWKYDTLRDFEDTIEDIIEDFLAENLGIYESVIC